ncbi:deoxyribodipyrimidine photo-lyase [Trichlorobacter ammonificans]|uniref:Deoxyribodipyrimidine photo-lyase n=1 Tax=Trichlorobacter ammonificans TaxID=2916410 RepID=A0ABN8HJ40_9BACT|nr:deoxyribodipyrimidine photo-lyase [Trichlorobacter ammonificans]CAH2031308.1 Deoxyribodipyrimidine photo-lyase [Trichlorobacter ammonificans]
MIDPRRIHLLNNCPEQTGPVLYWMSREQRVADNWGLCHAQQLALKRRQALVVVFTLADSFLGATLRQYGFMLRGLEQVRQQLAKLNIPFVLLRGEPRTELLRFIGASGAGCVVCDFDPLRIKRTWREGAAAAATVPFIEVDGHNIVPCRVASPKREYGAYTLRPKLHRLLPEFLTPLPRLERHPFPWSPPLRQEPFDLDRLLSELPCDRSVPEVSGFMPGEEAAAEALADFITTRLPGYALRRNDPCANGQSGLSPWLHFGQLSPQRVALAATAGNSDPDREAFLEELIVRRELADNFCWHCPGYDRLDAAPDWARATLEQHRHDPRPWCYGQDELEHAASHDPLWNAAQRELTTTGKMHGYLRMYWAKKILEWSASPEEALAHAIFLNDRYALDGRDPNGYAGIAWSVCGVHDRAWGRRPIFGTIRYMSFEGCRRKFDVARYSATVY